MIKLAFKTILLYCVISAAFNYANAKTDPPMERILGDKNHVTIQIYKRPDGGIVVYNDLGKVFETVDAASPDKMRKYLTRLGYSVIITEEYINQRRKQ